MIKISSKQVDFILSLVLVIICLVVLTVYVNNSTSRGKTSECTREKSNNDSLLVSEYQKALDSFRRVNPTAAQQFMQLIENQNQ